MANDDHEDDQLLIEQRLHQLRVVARKIQEEIDTLDSRSLGVDDFLNFRAWYGIHAAELDAVSAELFRIFGVSNAQQRMTEFLLQRIGEPVLAAELAGVSCISEWARRKRELAVEQGFMLEARTDGTYVLHAADRDEETAERWRQLNRIRKAPGSGADRMLQLLIERHPDPVSNTDLDYVAKIRSRDRRKRDLEEAGWRIASIDDDPTLPAGWYRLDSLEKGPPRARETLKLRESLLRHADFTCARCNYRVNGTERRQLQVHHVRFLRDGGNDDPRNLRVLCSHCHAGIHALDKDSVRDELLYPDSDPLIVT